MNTKIKIGKPGSSCNECGCCLSGEEYRNPRAGSRVKVCLECHAEEKSNPGVDVLLFQDCAGA
jgi:hypothetical protein